MYQMYYVLTHSFQGYSILVFRYYELFLLFCHSLLIQKFLIQKLTYLRSIYSQSLQDMLVTFLYLF